MLVLNRYFLVVLFVMSCVLGLPYFKIAQAQEESITITTYYPSPFGVYRQLTVTDVMYVGTAMPLISTTSLISGGYIRAPRFEDRDDTTYYVDPNGTSYFSGSIGIGTAPSTFSLDTPGNIRCASLTQTSSRNYKKDIRALTSLDYTDILGEIGKVDLVYFRYKTDREDSALKIGLIAEDAPKRIVSEDGQGINTYSALSFLMAAVKAQQVEINALKEELSGLKEY